MIATLDRMTIADAKRVLLLPELARRLNIAGEIPERDGQTVRCFWPERHKHGDRNRSFNFHDGMTRFKCFGCGAGGDGPDMIREMLSVTDAEARKLFLEWAGGGSSSLPEKRAAGRSTGTRHTSTRARIAALSPGLNFLAVVAVPGQSQCRATRRSPRSSRAPTHRTPPRCAKR